MVRPALILATLAALAALGLYAWAGHSVDANNMVGVVFTSEQVNQIVLEIADAMKSLRDIRPEQPEYSPEEIAAHFVLLYGFDFDLIPEPGEEARAPMDRVESMDEMRRAIRRQLQLQSTISRQPGQAWPGL